MNKLSLSILISSFLFSASALSLQGENFLDLPYANQNGSNVGFGIEPDGGLVFKGENNMESTLTVENTRDAGGEKAPVVKVVGRNEKPALNEARPLLRVQSIENQAGIELIRSDQTKAAGAVFGWTIFNDDGDMIFREIREAGNWTHTYFYKLESKMLKGADDSVFMAQVFVPHCPKFFHQDKNGEVKQVLFERNKEEIKTCSAEQKVNPY